MSQQSILVITVKYNSISTYFARHTLHYIQDYVELCSCCCHIGSWGSFWHWALLSALPHLFSAAELPACNRNSYLQGTWCFELKVYLITLECFRQLKSWLPGTVHHSCEGVWKGVSWLQNPIAFSEQHVQTQVGIAADTHHVHSLTQRQKVLDTTLVLSTWLLRERGRIPKVRGRRWASVTSLARLHTQEKKVGFFSFLMQIKNVLGSQVVILNVNVLKNGRLCWKAVTSVDMPSKFTLSTQDVVMCWGKCYCSPW